MFFADCSTTAPNFKPEINTEVGFFTISEIYNMALNGQILHQPHVGLLLIAVLKGFVNFEFELKKE